tara:strand:+ start:1158 stop:3155 length:1998 start_codon:yes stop_codon:yes gene_type:complete
MAIYELEDPATGRKIKIESEQPPTQNDAKRIFEQPAQTGGFVSDDYNENAERFGKVGQGLTFGFGDEITSGIAALVKSAASDKSFGEIYDQTHSRKQQDRERFEKDNPYESLALEIAGGLATGGAGAGRVLASQAIRNAPRLAKIGTMSGLGAVEGGVYGAGTADQDQRLQGGAEGAVIGSVAAPLGAGFTNILGRVAGSVADRAAKIAESSPNQDALRVIREMADAGEIQPDDVVSRMRELGPEATIADTADVFRQTARATINSPGRVRQEGLDLVDSRNAQQRERLLQGVREDVAEQSGNAVDEFVTGAKQSFLSLQDDIIKRRSEQAAPLYAEALETGIEITPMIKPLLSNSNVFKGANEMLKAEGLPPLKRPTVDKSKAGETAFDDMTPQRRFEVLKAAKEGLDDQINFANRSGKNNVARVLTKQKNALLGAMVDQNAAYGKANRIFSDESSLQDAVKLGRGFLLNKYEPEELKRILGDFTEGEFESFQVGAIDAIAKTMNKSTVADKTRVFRNSADYQDKVRLVLGDKTDNFLNRLDIEEEFEKTRQGLAGNSTTIMQKKFDESLQESIDPGLVRDLANANAGTIVGKVVNTLTRQKPSADTINQIGSILLKQGYTEKQIRNILNGSGVRKALGADYDDVLSPYTQSIGISAATPIAMSE